MHKIIAFYDRWHWVILSLVAPFLLFPSPRWSFVLLVLPLAWLLVRLIGGRPFLLTPFNGAIYVLCIMLCVSLFVTYDFTVSQPKIAGLLLGIGTFYTIVRISQDACGWWVCLLAFLGLGVAMTGVALVGTQWEDKLGIIPPAILQPLQSLTLPFGGVDDFNPNEVAGALLWVLPLLAAVCAILIWQPHTLLHMVGKLTYLIILCATLTMLLFVFFVFIVTQSRSGYIGLAVVILLLSIWGWTHFWQRWRMGSWVLITILALAIGLFIYGPGLQQANTPTATTVSTQSLETLDQRREIWERALYAIHDFPFTGTGMNTFRHVVHLLYPLFLIPPDIDIGHAHNEFLQAALDLGLPGLVAFLAIYMIAFALLRQLWLSTPVRIDRPAARGLSDHCQWLLSANLRYLTFGLTSSLLGHLVYSFTDAIALGAKPGILFWILLGLIASLFMKNRS